MSRSTGPVFAPAVYRRRRRRALRLLREHCDVGVPLLLCARPAAGGDPTPPAGRPRQDPWFDYFCGCQEPEAALLLEADGRTTLLLEAGDPARVVWEGIRLAPGPAARRLFGVHATASVAEARDRVRAAADAAGGRIALCWRRREPGPQSRAAERWRRRLGGLTRVNAEPVLASLRRVKDAEEIERLRRAVAITAGTLRRVLPRLRSLGSEAAVAAALTEGYLAPAFAPPAFAPIVGGGINGATLHYTENADRLPRRAPVLIDSGATCDGYCADVTRTVPADGRFRGRFREVYELVLRANRLGRKHARPGITLAELDEIAWEPITAAGFERHHRLGHHLGLDVHDVGDRERPLEPGVVITDEPGVYLPDEGFGVRIEDDLAITADGCEELTRRIPRTVASLERVLGTR